MPRLFAFLKDLGEAILFALSNKNDSMDDTPMLPVTPVPPAYLWDTPINVRHSVRVICDEEGLSVDQKNTLCATVEGESGFDTHAKNYNYAFHTNGSKYLASTDFGVCQWNDYYHGKEISPQEAEFNPEKAVRLMCTYWKLGRMNQWCAYSNQRYKLFM